MAYSATRLVALGAFVLAAHAVAPTPLAHPEPRGIWSAGGGTLYQEVHPLTRGAVSPDGHSAVRATAQGLEVQRGANVRRLPLTYTPGLAEVVWSPGARQVAINASSGGAIGTWDTHVLNTADASAALPVRQLVEARLGKRWACGGAEALNLGTVGWDKDELLVIAEVPPRPGCANGGAIVGVRIDPGRRAVLGLLDELALRRDWRRLLGSRFQSLN